MFNKKRVFLISFAHFIHDIFSSILAPILPLLIEKLNISLTQAGFLDIARKAPSLFNPFFGIILQKREIKFFIILTPSITAISMGLLSITSSYLIALFLLLIAGISAALFHIPAPTLIKEFSKPSTGKGMSYFMAAGESARTIGPIIAAGVISVWGLEGIWKLTPLGIITSIFLYFKLKDYKSEFNTSFKKENIKLAIAKTSSFFKKLTLFVLFNYTSKFSISLFLPLYLTKKGFSIESASIAYGILQGFGILGSFSAGRISDKIGRAKTLFIFSLFSAIFLFLFLGFSNIWLLSFLGFFLFAQSPILLALVHDIKTDAPTFINSIYMAINFGISSIIVLLSGFIAQKIGLELTFYISALLTFLSAFLALRLN